METDLLVDPDADIRAPLQPSDIDTFSDIYRRYLCSIYRFVRARTPDDATAEDLTAQVFFKVLRSASTFRGDGTFDAWIYRIARNSVATWHAQKARAAIAVPDIPDREDPAPSPPVQVIHAEQIGFVKKMIRSLPPAQRQVVSLRYLRDLSITEIARATKRTPGAVRILLHRARKRLRSLFHEAPS